METTSDGLPSEQLCLVGKCGRDEKKRDKQTKEEKQTGRKAANRNRNI